MSRVLLFCSEETDGDSSMRSLCYLPRPRSRECYYYLAIFLPRNERARATSRSTVVSGLHVQTSPSSWSPSKLRGARLLAGFSLCNFIGGFFGWIYEREREYEIGPRTLRPTNANLSPAPCHFLYSDGALASKRASSSLPRSLARISALSPPLPFLLSRRRPDYGHFVRHYKSTLDPYFMSRRAGE